MRLILASQSPSRLSILRGAGIEPVVIVSEVDEDAILDRLRSETGSLDPQTTVLALARAKCEAVTTLLHDDPSVLVGQPALVLGCDSMLEIGPEIVGKPHSPEVARARWREMRGGAAVLHSGHWMALIDDAGVVARSSGATSSATVHFANVTDAEIDAYVATDEPLHVAGAFTLDGFAGPYIERIEGDHHGILGLSLPLARELALELGVSWHDLWNRASGL